MLESERIVGIDLVRIDGDDGIYGIYESVDGGEDWRKLAESKRVYDLLDFAKTRYTEDTPLVMPQHIQSIVTYEIMEEAANQKIQAAKKESWLKRFFKSLFKRE